MEYADVIKLVSTRWFCLEMFVNREPKRFKGLKSYFLSENFPGENRFKRLKSDYSDNMTEIYLLFYQAVLPCFTNFNKLLQCEEPLVYKLHKAQQRFICKLA